MSRPLRLGLFWLGLAGFAALFLWGLAGLPPVGHYRGPYGDILNAVVVSERHVTDIVAAINFDYRGFDTLGEEFILFASVMGVLLLLRQHADEANGPPADVDPTRVVPPMSDAVRVTSFALIPPTVLFGLYVVTHGHLTPGGGFQGGVIITSAMLLLYLAGDFTLFKRLVPHRLVDVGESVAAGGFALIGLAGLGAGATFLANVLPLGQTGDVLSGGTIWLISVTTGLEVACGIFLVFTSFLEEALQRQRREEDA